MLVIITTASKHCDTQYTLFHFGKVAFGISHCHCHYFTPSSPYGSKLLIYLSSVHTCKQLVSLFKALSTHWQHFLGTVAASRRHLFANFDTNLSRSEREVVCESLNKRIGCMNAVFNINTGWKKKTKTQQKRKEKSRRRLRRHHLHCGLIFSSGWRWVRMSFGLSLSVNVVNKFVVLIISFSIAFNSIASICCFFQNIFFPRLSLKAIFCYCYCCCHYCFIVACVFVFYINE